MNKLLVLLTFGSALSTVSQAQILSEQFGNALAQGANLIGVAGSSGNNWSNTLPSADLTFATASLVYNLGGGQSLASSGGSAVVGSSGGLPQQAVTFDNAGVQYFSFLFQHLNAANVSGGRIIFEAFGSSNEGYGINYNRNTDGTLSIFARAGNANGSSSASVSASAAASPVLVVGRFDPAASTNGSTTIWVNPTVFLNEALMTASTPLSVVTAATAAIVRDDGIVFRTTSPPTGAWFQVDDLRVADTFSDLNLTVVPESATFAVLAAFGAFVCAGVRRRR